MDETSTRRVQVPCVCLCLQSRFIAVKLVKFIEIILLKRDSMFSRFNHIEFLFSSSLSFFLSVCFDVLHFHGNRFHLLCDGRAKVISTLIDWPKINWRIGRLSRFSFFSFPFSLQAWMKTSTTTTCIHKFMIVFVNQHSGDKILSHFIVWFPEFSGV